MKLVPDTWLSQVMGYEVFKAHLDEVETIVSAMVFPEGSVPKRAFCYTKIPVTSIGLLSDLTKAGFRVVDVNVSLEREPAILAPTREIAVRDFQPEDEYAVLEIALSAFAFSRFHLDPLIPKDLADRIKRKWIANYILKQRGERLLVAEVAGKAAGFLALLVTGEVERTGVIDLIGVARDMQGRGVGTGLVEYHICDAWQKYSRLAVGTQIANVPSLRLYQKCGYRVSNATYVMHAHMDEGRMIL